MYGASASVGQTKGRRWQEKKRRKQRFTRVVMLWTGPLLSWNLPTSCDNLCRRLRRQDQVRTHRRAHDRRKRRGWRPSQPPRRHVAATPPIAGRVIAGCGSRRYRRGSVGPQRQGPAPGPQDGRELLVVCTQLPNRVGKRPHLRHHSQRDGRRAHPPAARCVAKGALGSIAASRAIVHRPRCANVAGTPRPAAVLAAAGN